jgi:hypothetical protein
MTRILGAAGAMLAIASLSQIAPQPTAHLGYYERPALQQRRSAPKHQKKSRAAAKAARRANHKRKKHK